MFNLFKKKPEPEQPKSKYDGWEIVHYPIINKFRPRKTNGSRGGYGYILKSFSGGRHFPRFESTGEQYAQYFRTREECLEEIDLYHEQLGKDVKIERL